MRSHFPLAVLTTLALLAPAAAQQQALLEPADGMVYHGTQTAFGAHTAYLAALDDSMLQPAVRGIFLSIPGTRGPANLYVGLRSFLASADSIGFIPEVGLFLVSDTATDSIIAVSTQLDYIIDSIIAISQSYGRRMFVRIGGEFNGAGGDWNGGGYHPYYYVTMFRKIVDMYAARGLRDSVAFVWCYEPDAANDFDSVGVSGPLWYPGDTCVDWFGLDVFDAAHFDQSLPDTVGRDITKKGKSERFLAMARATGKPVYLNETSAIRVNITADSADSYSDWNAWFAKYWQFIDAHVEIKGFNYMSQDWESTGGWPGWGDSRIQNSTWLMDLYRQEMRRTKYIHLRSSAASVSRQAAPLAGVGVLRSFPNPFNHITAIRWQSCCAGHTRVRVFDTQGREVALLVDGYRAAGEHFVLFRSRGADCATYYYQVQVGTSTQTGKMVLAK